MTIEDLSTTAAAPRGDLDDAAAARRWAEATAREAPAAYRLIGDGGELTLALGRTGAGQVTWQVGSDAAVLCEGDPDDAELRLTVNGRAAVVFGECRVATPRAIELVAAFVASPRERPPGDWVDIEPDAPRFEHDGEEEEADCAPFDAGDLDEHTAVLVREVRGQPARESPDASLLAHAQRLRGTDRNLAAYLDACARHRDLEELAWGEWLVEAPRTVGTRIRLGKCVDGDPVEVIDGRLVRVSHETGEGDAERFEAFLDELDRRDPD